METKSESVSASSRTLCVLLDTNIWRSERLLNSPKAQSLIYTIHRRQGILALPEIVEMELPAAIQKAGREANQRAVQASREVSDILGKQDAISDCGDGEFLQAVEARIDALAAILKRVPLTIEITRSALEMVYEKLPPNDKKEEQFRDSAIWQTAIQLADKYKVCFVTTDGAFFEQGNEGFEAAQNILADCKRTAGALSLYRGVAPCLAALDEEMPKIDASLIEQSIVRQTEALIDIELEKEGLTHLSPRTVEIRVYALPADDRLAVDFTLREVCQPVSADDPRAGATCEMVALGGCYFSPSQAKVSSVHVEKIRMSHEKEGSSGYSARYLGLRDKTTPIVRPDYHTA
jgi:predicted nucleic acid-binding protein